MSIPLLLYYTDRYKEHETGAHPEQPRRMEAIVGALKEKMAGELEWKDPRAATVEEIGLVHTTSHIQAMKKMADAGGGYADPDTVLCPASYEIARLAAGALLAATDHLINQRSGSAFAAVRPPGHHARPNQAMGFCLFNNVAIAARYAQQKWDIKKVLILDWDVHHGNGTQEIFYEDDTVYYLSTHQYPHYPGTGRADERGKGKGEGYTRNLPFPASTPPETIVHAVNEALEEIVASFQPDWLLISAGFDGHRDDPLGNWLLEEKHFAEWTKVMRDYATRYSQGTLLSCLEGGYNLQALANSVTAHCKALREG